MVQYYDYVLGAIPLVLVGLTGLLALLGLDLTAAIPVAAGAAGLIIAHALFVNRPPQSTAAAAGTSQRHTAE